MQLPPEIIDAMRDQVEAMGFVFDPEGLSEFGTDEKVIDALVAMGAGPQDIAKVLTEKMAAARIEHGLSKCVREFGDCTLVSMPLEDLRCAYGYLALVAAGAKLTLDQVKQATQIGLNLRMAEPAQSAGEREG